MNSALTIKDHFWVAGPISINVRLRLVYVSGRRVPLTRGLYDMFVVLLQREGEIVPFHELHNAGCSVSPWMGDTRAVRQQMSKLSRMLGSAGRLITNVRGVGYALILDPSAICMGAFDSDAQTPTH